MLEKLKLNILVYVKYNFPLKLRQMKREKKDNTYDPICIPASHKEWIVDHEDQALPTDVSRKNIHEIFEGEGRVQKKQK